MTRLLIAASAVFFLAPLCALAPPTALASSVAGQTWTVPQCLTVWEAVNLMADTANPDDCLLGTTGEPGIPPPSGGGGGGGTGFLLLQPSGHILLQQGGSIECQSC